MEDGGRGRNIGGFAKQRRDSRKQVENLWMMELCWDEISPMKVLHAQCTQNTRSQPNSFRNIENDDILSKTQKTLFEIQLSFIV